MKTYAHKQRNYIGIYVSENAQKSEPAIEIDIALVLLLQRIAGNEAEACNEVSQTMHVKGARRDWMVSAQSMPSGSNRSLAL